MMGIFQRRSRRRLGPPAGKGTMDMSVILGIDIGGSTTKIVGLRPDGGMISMLRVRAEDQVTSLFGALGNYLTTNNLALTDVERVVLTGVGTSYVEGDIYGLRFGKIKRLAEQGDLGHVDLTIRDISKNAAATLDPDMTAANFGNLAEDAAPADLAAGVVNLVLQAIGTMTVLACQACGADTVILTGSMTTLSQVEPNFQLFEKLYGFHYIVPENATFATAIGAGLCSLRQQS